MVGGVGCREAGVAAEEEEEEAEVVVVAVGEKKSARPTRPAESNTPGGHANGNLRRALRPPVTSSCPSNSGKQ